MPGVLSQEAAMWL